jgi:hypothetical protein
MWIFAPSRICAELYHRDSPDSCFAGDQQLVPIGIETAVNEIRALRNLQGILLKHVLASRFFDNTECMFCGGPDMTVATEVHCHTKHNHNVPEA